jgi:cyclophilin family peptidyl-prolyl cis-trans isomerase
MFFILLAPSPFMKGRHTFFAVLEDSWDTVSHILARQRKGDTKMDDAYLIHEPVRILSITIK